MEKRSYQKGVIFLCNENEEALDIEVEPGIKDMEIHFNLLMPESKKSFPDVQELTICEDVTDIKIPNTLFPNVVLVKSESRSFYDNENCLIKNDNCFRKLLNVFCGPDTEFDLTNIHRIADYAFSDSNITKFKDIRKTLYSCERNAFTNSVFDKRPFVGGVKMAGDILFAVDENAETITLHDEEKSLYMCADGVHLSKVKHMIIHDCLSVSGYKIEEMPQCITLNTVNNIDAATLEHTMHMVRPKNGSYIHEFHLSDNVSSYKEVNGMIYTKDMSLLVGCSADKEEAIIPEGVKKIASYAFTNTHVKYIKLPDSLETIQDYAFCKCSELTDIDFGGGLSCISRYAFLRCSHLEYIKLPEQMRVIGSFAFSHSGLKSIELNDGLRIIHNSAFDETQLSKLALPDSLEILEPLGKSQCITYISAEKYIARMASSIFSYGKLTGITSYDDAVVEFTCAGRTLFIPKYIRNKGYSDMCRRINVFFSNNEDDENISLYSYAATVAGRENTALKEYLHFHGDAQKEYLKKHATQIISRLMNEKDQENVVQFLKLDLISNKKLKELLKLSNDLELSIVSSYVLEKLNGKTSSGNFNI